MTFKNKHLSYSRISKYERCPLSFKLQYIDGQRSKGSVATAFGSLIHEVLEDLISDVIEQEHCAPLSEQRALELFKQKWTVAGLTGGDVYQEGCDILKDFVHREGVVDHMNILSVEQEFHLPVGDFDVLGYIDRVDRIDDETIEIIDYKTNRLLFTRDEVDTTLQMSLYHLAAKKLWPFAKKIKLSFNMLRHGLTMHTERTDDQLESALAYVETVGYQTENSPEFPAKLNTYCVYCDHKDSCSAYADALAGKQEFICENESDLEAVAKEREEVASKAKILYARKAELEKILKSHLNNQASLELNGMRYGMYSMTRYRYPADATVELLTAVSDLSEEKLRKRLTTIDNKALDRVLKTLSKKMDRANIRMLKAELESKAKTSHSQRFWAKGV